MIIMTGSMVAGRRKDREVVEFVSLSQGKSQREKESTSVTSFFQQGHTSKSFSNTYSN